MAEVQLKNVSKVYEGGNIAVKEINIDVKDREFVVLVGPSGCGKSTTLRMIAGLEDISKGELYIDGKLVNDVAPKDRNIAMVFQNYALYPHMTVYENMAFGLKLRKFDKKEIKIRVNDAAKILGIEEYLERKPKALSGGQRQRVAVGRAIVRKPKVFLFDEPLSNLDAKLRVQMRTQISKLHHSLNATMIYVTHDQTEAMTMGDRICVMKDGVIQQVDGPLSLYDKPSNKFVAGFIGSPPMNFVDVEIIKKGEDIFLNEGMFELKAPKQFKEALAPYALKKMTLGVRPEDIYDKLFYTMGPKDGNGLSATIEVVEPLGSEIFLHFNTGKNTLVAKVDAHNQAKTNQVIELVINMNKVHLYDTRTGISVV